MRDDPLVIDLVERALGGEQASWDAIVEMYTPLVWSVCRRYGLPAHQIDDIVATVWLRLVERLGSLRDPAALPGWLRTTARNECLHCLEKSRRTVPVDIDDAYPDVETTNPFDEWCVRQERMHALRAAFASSPERCRKLLALLFADPPLAYAEVSRRMQIPVGGIGPTRQRCLAALRAHPLLVDLDENVRTDEGALS